MKKLTDIYQEQNIVNDALASCENGYPSKALMQLYKVQNKINVPWHLFPSWARPDTMTEGYHEG